MAPAVDCCPRHTPWRGRSQPTQKHTRPGLLCTARRKTRLRGNEQGEVNPKTKQQTRKCGGSFGRDQILPEHISLVRLSRWVWSPRVAIRAIGLCAHVKRLSGEKIAVICWKKECGLLKREGSKTLYHHTHARPPQAQRSALPHTSPEPSAPLRLVESGRFTVSACRRWLLP